MVRSIIGMQIAWLLLVAVAIAQAPRVGREYPPSFPEAREEVYKQAGDVALKMFIFEPPDRQPKDRRAAVVFFFGGGWRSGTPAQFHEQCKYRASRGMVAITVDYRVLSRHKTKAVTCVEDAKSAIRWVRKNSERLGIDPQRIAAAGGSAGGHLAACTGVVPGFESPTEDAELSSVPNALVLFNPALVLSSVKGQPPLPKEKMVHPIKAYLVS
jgi:acetyl esterase